MLIQNNKTKQLPPSAAFKKNEDSTAKTLAKIALVSTIVISAIELYKIYFSSPKNKNHKYNPIQKDPLPIPTNHFINNVNKEPKTHSLSNAPCEPDHSLKYDQEEKPLPTCGRNTENLERNSDQILLEGVFEFFNLVESNVQNSSRSASSTDLKTNNSSFETAQQTKPLSQKKPSDTEDLLEDGLSDFFNLAKSNSPKPPSPTAFYTPMSTEENLVVEPIRSPSAIKKELAPKEFPLLIEERKQL